MTCALGSVTEAATATAVKSWIRRQASAVAQPHVYYGSGCWEH